MTRGELLIRILSVFVPIALGFAAIYIVPKFVHPGMFNSLEQRILKDLLENTKKSGKTKVPGLFSHINRELIKLYDLRNDKEKFNEYLTQLQNTTWKTNYEAVSITAPILVTVVSIIISYMFAQKLGFKPSNQDYFPYFRNIILTLVTLGMILSGLSMQLWVICLDQGRTVGQYILARIFATVSNLLSWLCVYTAVFLLISLISPKTAFAITSIGVAVFIIYLIMKNAMFYM